MTEEVGYGKNSMEDYAKLDAEKLRAEESGDSLAYFRTISELGEHPSNQLLFEQGQLEASLMDAEDAEFAEIGDVYDEFRKCEEISRTYGRIGVKNLSRVDREKLIVETYGKEVKNRKVADMSDRQVYTIARKIINRADNFLQENANIMG